MNNTSNEILITGLDKDNSDHFEDTYLTFSRLTFDLSAQPSNQWIEIYSKHSYGYATYLTRDNFKFHDAKFEVSNIKIKFFDLQDFIDQLKKSFASANNAVSDANQWKAEKDQLFDKTIDSLKF